jgi:hypothetical protein
MATKTQFLPYAHRYQDSTAGLRDALTNIQAGINQRGELRIREADQKIKQNEADRLTAQRSFLANYQPTLSEDHLTNEGLERYNSLIEHNQDHLSAMGDDERESVRQKLLRETADASRVARTVREDIMGSGFFDPADVDILATSYGSGYTDYAAASKAAYDAEASRAKDRAALFKDATTGLGNVFGKEKTGTGSAWAGLTDSETQALLAAGAPDPKTGLRPGFPQKFNNHNNPRLQRYNDIFQDDPKKDRYIDLLENRGLVTYQKNVLTPEFIDNLVKTATADNSLGWHDNAQTRRNVEAGVRAYYHNLNETAADGDGRVAAPPPEVLLQVLFDGVTKGGFLSDHDNTNADAFFTSAGAAEIAALFEKAHDKYLEDSEKELEALLKRMAEQNFDFYGTKFPELNQRFYGEKPALTQQDIRTFYGRTETGGAYAAPTQAAQRQAATNDRAVFNTEVDSLIQQTATDYGIPVSYLNGLVSKEAGWDGAVSPTGATGIGQMVQSTWNDLAARPEGKAIGMVPVTKENFRTENDPRKDNAVNLQATALLTQINAGHLARAGVEPTSDNLYMVHNMGTSIIPVLAGENPGAKSAASVEKNARHNGKRADETIAEWVERQKADYRSHEAKRGGSELAAAVPGQQAGAQLWTATGSLQQQGHPATEHLRALLGTYPQPYTEKSFTYDKVDAAFRRLGLTVPAAEKVQANLTPVAAGVGAFPRIQVGTPAVPAAQPTSAAVPAAPAANVADVRADPVDADGRNMAPSVPVDWEGRNNWKPAHQTHLKNMLSSMEGSQDPHTMLLREYIVRGLATGNREAEMLIDRELTARINKETEESFKTSGYGHMMPPLVMPPELEELPALEDLDQEFLRKGVALMATEPLRETRHDRAEAFRRLTEQAQTRKREFEREQQERERRALAEYMRNQPVRGDLADILWSAGPGEVPVNLGPFNFTVRHLPTDRNADPPVHNGPGTARSAWEQTMSELLPSTQSTTIGPPQTAAPESRFSPPMLPEPVRSLPEQREESSNNFLMLRQDRQQELRDLIDSRTNQGINSNQQPEQEAAEETAGVSERYEMLADIIREFQQGVGSNRRMTLGNIA